MSTVITKAFGIELTSVESCAQVSALADGAVLSAVEFIAGKLGTRPTFDEWEGLRLVWRDAYMTQRDLDPASPKTSNTLDVAWSRNVAALLDSEYGLKKPKAATPAAIKKAADRALPEALKNAKTVADLQAVPMPDDALEAAKLQKAIAETTLRMVKLETDAASKAAKEATKARREALIKYVKDCDALALAELEAMRDHQTEVVLAALPLEEIEAATKALKKKAPRSKATDPATS